jgi:hypothetical protein
MNIIKDKFVQDERIYDYIERYILTTLYHTKNIIYECVRHTIDISITVHKINDDNNNRVNIGLLNTTISHYAAFLIYNRTYEPPVVDSPEPNPFISYIKNKLTEFPKKVTEFEADSILNNIIEIIPDTEKVAFNKSLKTLFTSNKSFYKKLFTSTGKSKKKQSKNVDILPVLSTKNKGSNLDKSSPDNKLVILQAAPAEEKAAEEKAEAAPAAQAEAEEKEEETKAEAAPAEEKEKTKAEAAPAEEKEKTKAETPEEAAKEETPEEEETKAPEKAETPEEAKAEK